MSVVGYSSTRKAYRMYNKRTLCNEQSFHVIFDEFERIENLKGKDDSEIEELLQIQRDSPIEDMAGENKSQEANGM